MLPAWNGGLVVFTLGMPHTCQIMQEARRLMEALTAKINRYNQAAVFLRTEMVLPNEMHVVAVTRPLQTCQGQVCTEEEVVVAKDAAWGKPYPSPPSWGAQVLYRCGLLKVLYQLAVLMLQRDKWQTKIF